MLHVAEGQWLKLRTGGGVVVTSTTSLREILQRSVTVLQVKINSGS